MTIVKNLFIAWLLSMLPGLAFAGDYADTWGPPAGTVAPAILAEDQSGTARGLDSLTGANGLLLVLVRSADW